MRARHFPANRTYCDQRDAAGRAIALYTERDFDHLARVGRIAADTLDRIAGCVCAGVCTLALDREIDTYIRSRGAVPATIGYRGYRHASCISVNHVAVHGVPSQQTRLVDGDIVNIDITPKLSGFHGDTSRTFLVGDHFASEAARRVTEAAYAGLWAGIDQVRPGNSFYDLAVACQRVATDYGVSIEPAFGGHGTGLVFHDAPHVHHDPKFAAHIIFEPGMVFTVEPVLNAGAPGVEILSDGWTAVTRDSSPSAQFEHTIGVSETGARVFTLSAREREADIGDRRPDNGRALSEAPHPA